MSDEDSQPQSIDQVQKLLANEYVEALLYLTAHSSPHLPELNYVKTEVTFPTGGRYLLSLLHVSGPKVDLEEIRNYKPTDTKETS